MNRATVLISTYNGEKHISPQLESIINEKADLSIRIRDDSSSDNTVSLIKSYINSHPEINFFFEPSNTNIKPCLSFSKLISESNEDYIFLCDQDDVWVQGRAQRMLDKIQLIESSIGASTPLLLISDAVVVDSNLQKISPSFWDYEALNSTARLEINSALIQNISPGCTMLFNKALADLVDEIPAGTIMHDWWLYLVAACFGKVCFLEQPTILYRQHSNNAIGAKKARLPNPLQILQIISKSKKSLTLTKQQASLLLNSFPNLPKNKRDIVENFIAMFELGFFRKRISICRNKFYKSSLLRNIGLFFLV